MSDHRSVDAALRRVAVPDDLGAALRPEALFADGALDRLLADVPVPTNLVASIHLAVSAQPTRLRDGALDLSRFASASTATVSSGLLPGPRMRPRSALPSLARDIASVVAALGLVVVLTAAGVEFSRRLEGEPSANRAITRLDFGIPDDGMPGELPMRLHVPSDRGVYVPSVGQETVHATPAERTDHTGNLASASRTSGGPQASQAVPLVVPPVVRGAPVYAAERTFHAGMTTVDIPGITRRRVPRARGYDLAFEVTTGEQPFVDPAVAPELVTDTPPLTLQTDGFESLTALHDRRPGPVRAEDVLAAVSPSAHAVRPDEVALGIHEVRGLRSVGGTPTVLVEISATAGPMAHPDRPVDVTLVLDQAAAGDPAAWRRMCRAVVGLAGHLSDDDCVRVVLCGPRARVVLAAGSGRDLAALASDLEWQPASASADLEGGLRLAQPANRIIVLAHANSLEGARGSLRTSLISWHSAMAFVGGDTLSCQPEGGTRFVIVDPAALTSTDPGEPTFGRTSPDVLSIRRDLIRQVFGRDSLVARACRLDVRFDPRRVSRYRLIGHRQSAVESLSETTPRGTDLHAGETVRAVYEVVPRAPVGPPGLASAVLTWTNPRGSRDLVEAPPNRSTKDLGDGLPSPHGCELLLAAGIGELAAGSAHTVRRPALMARLDGVIAQWRARGDMTAVGDALARSHERRASGIRKAW